ncbi:MAG: MBL fold metallo-hydrolase [Clostridia bacterium]
MRVCVLSSGSKGNSTFIEAGNLRLLVDEGLSKAEILKRLYSISVEPESISAILITHEHSDHIRGILSFAKRYKTKVYANEILWQILEPVFSELEVSQKIAFMGGDFFIEGLTVSEFSVPHDSFYCSGYSFYYEGIKASICTDIGHMTQNILNSLSESDIVIIESNHDKVMLENGKYPYCIKRRILSNKGHLCNEDCASSVLYLYGTGTRNFVLAHMSEENNTREKVLYSSALILKQHGVDISKDVYLEVASQHFPSTIFDIKGEIYERN